MKIEMKAYDINLAGMGNLFMEAKGNISAQIIK